jgi:hypothetical protein
MKKNYFLLAFLMFFASVITGNAQTYSLKDLSATDFAAGGNANWSFEQYDIATGTYSAFTTYGTAGQMNYFDRYNTERFAGYPIMSNPANLGGAYDTKRNGWYNQQNDFFYIARDYEDGTANVNLEYWTSIPDSLRGYEVYSSPLFVGNPYRNAAITFLIPTDGYYKVDMAVLREDNYLTSPMTVFQRFRYSGATTVPDISHLNQSFTYGVGGKDAIPVPPESPVVKNPWANAQKPVHKTFYLYAHANDKISFEADARSGNNAESTVRGEYGRTKWTNLVLTVVPEATAKADPSKFQDPYNTDLTLKTKLDSLMTVIADYISNYDSNVYPQTAVDALGSTYTTIDATRSSLQPLDYPGVISQLEAAIGKYTASSLGLKAQYLFNDVTNGQVPDASGSGNTGTLVNQASIMSMGKYKVLNLGSSNGYLDMGANVGNVISSMSNYTISAYYLVDPSVTLSGNGLFLWTFSTQTANGASSGQYIYYQLQNQRMAVANAGWNSEKAVTLASAANKGVWQHVVYTQTGTVGQLYINGVMVQSTDPMPIPSAVFTTSTPYNWIGRPGFNDPYLIKTLVYDVRLYNQTVPTDSITKWASLTTDLDNELNTATGDFTALSALISQYTTFLPSVVIGTQFGQYTQAAKTEFSDAIAAAQAFVTANAGSQILIDSKAAALTAAYNKFLASINNGMNTLAEGEYFFKVNDSYVNNPGATLAADGQVPSVANQGIVTNRIIDNAGEIFKLTFVTSLTPARYSIFSTLDESGVLRHLTETCVYQSAWGTPGGGTTSGDDNWRTFNIFNNGTACAVQCFGAAASKGYWTYDATNQKLADSNNGSTAQYFFNFIPVKTVFAEEVAKGRIALNAAVVGPDLLQYDANVYNTFKTALETAEAAVTAGTATSADLIAYGAARKLFANNNGDTAVNDVLDNNLKVIAGNRNIRISAENSVKVTVYDITGAIVSETIVSGERTFIVNSGLYLVKAGGKATKVLVR